MDIQQCAEGFVRGDFVEVAGIGMTDAVHVLASSYGFNKADLRAAIYAAYAAEVEEVEAVEEETPESIDEYLAGDVYDYPDA